MSTIEAGPTPAKSDVTSAIRKRVDGRDIGNSPRERLSVDWLVSQKDLPALVAVLPPGQLHGLLMEQDLDDCAEVLEWVRGEALIRIFDLDLWTSSLSDPQQGPGLEISAPRFLDWVSAWRTIEPGFVAKRFFELDEQTLVLITRALFEIVPVGLENGVFVSDDFFMAPDNKFHLKLRVTGTRDEELALVFLGELFDDRFEVASRVLAYASMLVIAECEEEAIRLREGRLADEGFVSQQEAMNLLRARGFNRWTESTKAAYQDGEKRIQQAALRLREQGGVSSELMPDLIDGFADTLRILEEPRRADIYQAVLPPAQLALLLQENFQGGLTTRSLSNEIAELASDENLIWDVAQEALLNARSRLMTLDHGLDADITDDEDAGLILLIDRVLESLASDDPEAWTNIQTRLARQANAVASLFRDAASPSSQQLAAKQLRGALNLGLEWMSEGQPKPGSYNVQADSIGAKSPSGISVERALSVLRELGPEAIFRAGLDLYWELSVFLSRRIEALLPDKAKGMTQFVEIQRYDAAREMIWKNESAFEAPIRLAAESLFRRFPLAPQALLAEQLPSRLEPSSRVLCTLAEWMRLWSRSQALTDIDHPLNQRVNNGVFHAKTDIQ